MTHREIMAISETVADYIGYALANGWQKVHICENLNREYPVDRWSIISDQVEMYLKKYEIGAPEGMEKPEGEFDSITEAAKSLGLTYKQYNYFKKRGRRVLSVDGKEYMTKKELMDGEGITRWEYDQRYKAGIIKAERVFHV